MLKDVPRYLPALMRSEKIQKKAGSVGFDWDDIEPVFGKVREETDELKEAYTSQDAEKIEEEYGDLLFAAVNLGRFLKLTPEISLAKACDKFITRFNAMEREAEDKGADLAKLSLEEMDKLWENAKKKR